MSSKYDGVKCSVAGCESEACTPHEIGPVCNAHYQRFRKRGTFKYLERGSASKNPAYRTWINMKSRCLNKNATGYKIYGGRGIGIHPEWQSSFDAFLRDVGPRPRSKHSLDRIDVNKGYEPGNCRWATQTEQCRNMRVNHIVEIDDIRMTLAEAVEESPVCYNTVLYRLKRGWSVGDALTLPPQQGVRP